MNHAVSSRFLSVVALAVATFASAPAQATSYSSLVVFGDSLADNGNNAAFGLFDPNQVVTGNAYIPSNTYFPKTYSNGPVWATDFAALLGLPLLPSALGGTDYAFGGATTGTPGPGQGGFPFSLEVQAAMYLGAANNVASPSALYAIEGGGNDARAALNAIAQGANPTVTIAAAANSFASNIGTIVDELRNAGAQHIVVWDSPNLGLAPAVVAGGAASAATFLSAAMNSALTSRLVGETGVLTFDIFGLGSAIAQHPGTYGLTNTTDACGALTGVDCSKYAYWDGIHPTAAAHGIIANALLAVVAPVPEPETWALTLLGLTLLGWKSRRSRATTVGEVDLSVAIDRRVTTN
ncbi:MAG: SGNH/GDSL hydrolase family protein [Pseudomonadota bacterium]|nr:SGNH/GDSL hydrolase family protein [Pseudomonadota bacterium]